jgi:hypothetical protein
MTDADKVKNILAFLIILLGESYFAVWEIIMDFSPDYLLEKYERYILSDKPEYEWGLHHLMKDRLFNKYCDKWKDALTKINCQKANNE